METNIVAIRTSMDFITHIYICKFLYLNFYLGIAKLTRQHIRHYTILNVIYYMMDIKPSTKHIHISVIRSLT